MPDEGKARRGSTFAIGLGLGSLVGLGVTLGTWLASEADDSLDWGLFSWLSIGIAMGTFAVLIGIERTKHLGIDWAVGFVIGALVGAVTSAAV